MTFLAPLLFTAILGSLFVGTITKAVPIRFYGLFIASLALPVGFSICSLLTFFAYLISPNQGHLLALFTAIAMSVFFLTRIFCSSTHASPSLPSLKSSTRLQKTALGFCVILWLFSFFLFFQLFVNVSLANIFGGWDAKFFWNVKAKFFFRSPAEWRNMFDSAIGWTHQDYPLLVPGSVAWGWNWTGKELQIWPATVAFSFLFSIALFILWYLSSATHLITGLLASAFFMTVGAYSFWGVSQYADVPLSFFMTASGIILLEALRSKNLSLWMLAGWLAGCAAWTKNEGLFFIGWIGLVAGSLQYFYRIKDKAWLKPLFSLGLGLSIPFFAILILKEVLAKTGDYLGSGRGAGSYFQAIFMDPQKSLYILKSFPVYMFDSSSWNGLWIFYFSALFLLFCVKKARQSDTWVTGTLALLILFGYFVILHTSPHNVAW